MEKQQIDQAAVSWMDIFKPSLMMTLGLIALLSFIAVQMLSALPPRTVILSTGSVEGAYHKFGELYRQRLATYGIDLQLLPGAGSIETLERLQAGTVDVGFVQTGTAERTDSEGLRTVASLFYEPVWIFHQDALELATLRDLRGLRIGVGEIGSGSRPVALQLLAINGIDETQAEFVELSSSQSADALIAGEIDVAIMVLSPRADLVLNLLETPGIAVLSEERVLAYSRAFSYFSFTQLPQGVVNFARNVPQEDIDLLSVTGTLVVQGDAHPNLVRLLLRTARDIHREGQFLETRGQFPSEISVELMLHPTARDYFLNGETWFETHFPFNLAVMLDRLVVVGLPLLTLFTLYRTIQPIYLLHVQYQITRWYRTLSYVDLHHKQLTLDEIETYHTELNEMLYDLTQRVSIPFFYWNRVYVLKAHIIQVIGRLEDMRRILIEANAKAEETSV